MKKTTKNNVKKFAIKMSIFASVTTASIHISKHPDIIYKGQKTVNSILNKNKSKTVDDIIDDMMSSNDSGIFSKSLNRMLTVEEAAAKGFL